MMKAYAVIFDMDGTLLNTLEDIGDAANRVLQFKNLPLHPIEEYRFFVGEGARILVERILPSSLRTEEMIDECLQLFLEEYDKSWNNKSDLYPGIAEMLDSLQAHGISKSILSNKPDEFTKRCAEKYLSKWKFEFVFGSSDAVPRKPNPKGALQIKESLSVKPDDFYFVGDTRIDMETARRAGSIPIGVLWGFRPKEELVESGAIKTIEKPSELLKLFGI